MRRILIPCDFSRQSNEAYSMAINLASQSKGKIILLHVLPPVTGYLAEPLVFDPGYSTESEEDVKKALEKMKEMVDPKSISVATQVAYGDLVSCIKNVIESEKIDLVVMGTSGASGIEEIFIGSNTEKIVRFSPVPVLAVRTLVEPKLIKNILLPSTLDLNQSDFIKKLKELQSFFDATLHVLLVNTPAQFKRDLEGKEGLEEFVKHYNLENYKLHFRSYRREDDGIIDFAYSEKMDLIAMATHARSGLAHVFNGSTTENVVNHIQIPIWTYHLKT